MKYKMEFLRACRLTVAVVILLAILEIGIPYLVGVGKPVEPMALLLGMLLTTVCCQIFFTLMNIINTKISEKRQNGKL